MKSVKWNSILKLTLALGLVLGLGLMAGCGDDDDPTDPGGGTLPTGTITCTLDGNALSFSENASATNMGEADERILGGGNQDSNQVILITVPEAEGSYTVDINSVASVILTDGNMAWVCASGTLVLTTSSDTRLVGSFIGTFEDIQQNTATVTNGAFDVPLTLVQ